MNEKMLTDTANDRINYIFRDLIGDEYDEIYAKGGVENLGKTQAIFKFAAMMALDMKQSIGFSPSKELEDMITQIVWNGEEPSESEKMSISSKSWEE